MQIDAKAIHTVRRPEKLFVVRDADAKIRAAVKRIVKLFKPERIILFGSRAREDARPDSDADILVVMKVTGSKRRKVAQIDIALAGIGIPKDILVVTPEDFERYRDVVGTFIYPAAHRGKVLYDRSA